MYTIVDSGNSQHYKGMFGKDVPGGYQEFLCVPAHNLHLLPDDLSFAHAAVLGCAFSTSLHALYKVCGLVVFSSAVRILLNDISLCRLTVMEIHLFIFRDDCKEVKMWL